MTVVHLGIDLSCPADYQISCMKRTGYAPMDFYALGDHHPFDVSLARSCLAQMNSVARTAIPARIRAEPGPGTRGIERMIPTILSVDPITDIFDVACCAGGATPRRSAVAVSGGRFGGLDMGLPVVLGVAHSS